MNDENTFLPHFIEEEIYIIDEVSESKSVADKPALVNEPAAKPIAEEPAATYTTQKIESVEEPIVTLSYEGENTEKILLIVNSISSEEKVFLEKVLGAVKLAISDCALLQLSKNNSPRHHQLIDQFESSTFISFGGTDLAFMQNINNYKITFVGDRRILQVDNLKSIMEDVAKKKLLWECLQQLF